MASSWEENTERRLGIVEHKVDKLLDPEIGIYPKLGSIEDKLTRFFISLLLTLIGTIITVSIAIALGHG